MLCPIVCIVKETKALVKLELLLTDAAVANTVELHINGFYAFRLNFCIDDALCC